MLDWKLYKIYVHFSGSFFHFFSANLRLHIDGTTDMSLRFLKSYCHKYCEFVSYLQYGKYMLGPNLNPFLRRKIQ